METTPKSTSRFQVISLSVIVLLSIVIGLLVKQNQDLKNIMSLSQAVEPLKPGERIEPVDIETVDGKVSKLSYSDPAKKYLVLVFSTTCPHCEKNLVSWGDIVNNNKTNCDIIGLCIHSIGETAKYSVSKNLTFTTASVAGDTSFNRKYKISGVPETILVRGDGIVEKAWLGELSGDQTREIQDLMRGSSPLIN